MKNIFKKLVLPAVCLGILTVSDTVAFGQQKEKRTEKRTEKLGEYDQIIIKRKGGDVMEFSTKGSKGEKGEKGAKGAKGKKGEDIRLVIEINDDNLTVNGKPLAEFDDNRIAIMKKNIIVRDGNTMRITIPKPPRSPFQGQPRQNWNWNDDGETRVFEFNMNEALLGVATDKSDNGAKIIEVNKETAADKAGLKAGDIIIKVNDSKIEGPEDLTKAIGKYKPEDKVTITYLRDGKEKKASATLGKREGAMAFNMERMQGLEGLRGLDKLERLEELEQYRGFDREGMSNQFEFFRGGQPKLGIRAQDTEDGKGVKVLGVDEGSAAEKAGIKEGDVITSFDGKEINSVNELVDLSRAAREAKKMLMPLKYLREGKEQQAELKIPRKLRTAEL
ncbi:PDZ domain-containing protein [Flavihumibacter sp. ZG627]|uniref:PDZ domain-containing protein n=1 Tax=Flavihumibacter sp. ZG627 TaxID=1463156 RepID=UPI00057D99B8|nr:PDZ domain-containing protein [Flavihumibacter sp. ZG627]